MGESGVKIEYRGYRSRLLPLYLSNQDCLIHVLTTIYCTNLEVMEVYVENLECNREVLRVFIGYNRLGFLVILYILL